MVTRRRLPIPSLWFLFFLLPAFPAAAAVEIARSGEPAVTIQDVYLHGGVPYLAVDEVLKALELSGQWDSVAHVYRLKTPAGTAVISPGSHYLRLGSRFYTLSDLPRFIDGRLRVPEEFVETRIPQLIGEPIHYRNLNPPSLRTDEEGSPLDRLFAFLTRKRRSDSGGPALRGIALDPGHGGQDHGALGLGGEKEKTVALEVARRLEKLLKMRLGIPVHLSRDGDYALTLPQRLQPAARPDVDALVLLHAQASLSPAPRGVTLVVRPREEAEAGSLEAGEGESMRLARHLAQALQEAGLEVAGIVRAPLLPLGRGDLPTVLVELGYLSHPADADLLRASSGQDLLAEALFSGIRKFSEDTTKGGIR